MWDEGPQLLTWTERASTFTRQEQREQEEKAKDQCASEFIVSPEKLARLHARELDLGDEDENLMVS